MTKSLIKNTFREIKNTKARFISIMAIIALGVGFFAGIKATVPSMYNLARTYTDEQELMDYRLVSTVGFDEDDIKAVKNTDGVTSVMPSYFCDVQTDADSSGRTMRVIALPEKYGDNSVLNKLVLTEGRLPEKSGEIAADSSSFTAEGYKIGDKIRFAKQTGDTDTSTELKTLEYTVVGLVQSPLYIAYQRGTTTVGNGKISDYFYICPEDFAFERYTELYVKTDISDKRIKSPILKRLERTGATALRLRLSTRLRTTLQMQNRSIRTIKKKPKRSLPMQRRRLMTAKKS